MTLGLLLPRRRVPARGAKLCLLLAGRALLASLVDKEAGRIQWRDETGVLLTTRGHPCQIADQLLASATGVVGITIKPHHPPELTVPVRTYSLSELRPPFVSAGITPVVRPANHAETRN